MSKLFNNKYNNKFNGDIKLYCNSKTKLTQ